MSQSAIVTLVSLALYLSSLLGSGAAKPDRHAYPPPAASTQSHTQTTSGGVVTGSTVAVYETIGSRTSVGKLQRGDYVTILERQGSWYKVRLASGQVGYVTAFTLMPADSGAVARSEKRGGQYTILGYYVSDKRLPSLPSLKANSQVLTTVVPWTWEVTALGDLVASFDTRDTAAALKHAGDQGLRTYALIHNMALDSKGLQDFNSALAHQLLSSAAARARLIQNILRTLRDWRMSGVHIDFENVPPSDRDHLTSFMRELYGTLHPAGFEVTIAVPSKTRESLTNSWSGAYDYRQISRYVDQMMLMTYDEHWSGGPAGPIASIGWVEKVIRYALNAGVPANKIVLGIAGYGYDWPRSGRGRAVTYTAAMHTAEQYGVKVQWDSEAKMPYYGYGNGRQVWFENRQSVSHKLELVSRFNLAGISLWRLGQEDPGLWPVIKDMLG